MIGPALTIRRAAPVDAEAIRALVEKAYRGDSARRGWTHEADLIETDRTSLVDIAATIADPDRVMLIALTGAQVVGTVTAARIAPGRCYMGMLGVDPDCQAGGLGKRLIAAAEAAAVDLFGAQVMEMTVIATRRELVAWYVRLGYALTGEERVLPGMKADHLRMAVLERALAPVPVQPCDSHAD